MPATPLNRSTPCYELWQGVFRYKEYSSIYFPYNAAELRNTAATRSRNDGGAITCKSSPYDSNSCNRSKVIFNR